MTATGPDAPLRVLFVCTGNSARSLIAEALLRSRGGPSFAVQSAGTQPKGVNPLTLQVLADAGVDATGARSKSVDGFLGQRFDFVITVCDQARQTCPVFPGTHDRLHWDIEDPAAAEGTEEERIAAFRATLDDLRIRVDAFIPVALGTGTLSGS